MKVDDKTRRPVGAPPKMEDGHRVNVYLDARSIGVAKRLGNGNASEGIRKALAPYVVESDGESAIV